MKKSKTVNVQFKTVTMKLLMFSMVWHLKEINKRIGNPTSRVTGPLITEVLKYSEEENSAKDLC